QVSKESAAPRQDEQQTEQEQAQRRPRPEQAPAFATVRRWLYAMGAVVVVCLAAGLRADDGLEPDPTWPSLAERRDPLAANAAPIAATLAGPEQGKACTLDQFSETLISVSCSGSWALMRWTDRWVFDGGRNERNAL